MFIVPCSMLHDEFDPVEPGLLDIDHLELAQQPPLHRQLHSVGVDVHAFGDQFVALACVTAFGFGVDERYLADRDEALHRLRPYRWFVYGAAVGVEGGAARFAGCPFAAHGVTFCLRQDSVFHVSIVTHGKVGGKKPGAKNLLIGRYAQNCKKIESENLETNYP